MKVKKVISVSLALIFGINIAFTSSKAYAEEGYYPLVSEIVLPDGGYNVNSDYIGMKVIKINQALQGSSAARYYESTESLVRRFQMENDLVVSGEVDLETWLKLGYTEEEWYNIGTYTHPILTTKYSSREDIVNAMLIAAKEHAEAGTVYRVGTSGPAGTYADCSGLIFQCLYAAGINPEKNIVDHALAVYEYTSRNLEADDRLGDYVEESELEPGDLIFYHNKGIVCHVGIYVEDGMMYDSWPEIGVTYRSYKSGGRVLSIRRVLPHYDEVYPDKPVEAITGFNLPLGVSSMVIMNNPGEVVTCNEGEVLLLVTDGIISEVTESKDLSVTEDSFVVKASGEHAEYLRNEAVVGRSFTIEDALAKIEDIVTEEPIETTTEEPSQNKKPIDPYNYVFMIGNKEFKLHKFSFKDAGL